MDLVNQISFKNLFAIDVCDAIISPIVDSSIHPTNLDPTALITINLRYISSAHRNRLGCRMYLGWPGKAWRNRVSQLVFFDF